MFTKLCSRDLRTTIILLLRNLSLHKTDRILTKSSLPTLNCLLYRRVRSLMKGLEEECFCLREISGNVNKLLAVLLLYVFICFLYYTLLLVVHYLFTFFYTNVVAIFLFIHWSCKQAYYFWFYFLLLIMIFLLTISSPPFPFSYQYYYEGNWIVVK